MLKSALVLFALVASIAGSVAAGFNATVTGSRAGTTYSYSFKNSEAVGSSLNGVAFYVRLNVNSAITNVTCPPEWSFDTDYKTYIIWASLSNASSIHEVAPGQTLTGF